MHPCALGSSALDIGNHFFTQPLIRYYSEYRILAYSATVCYLNDYEDKQSIVAEFKKSNNVRYIKEIGSMTPSQKLTKFKSKKVRIASNCGHIDKNTLIRA